MHVVNEFLGVLAAAFNADGQLQDCIDGDWRRNNLASYAYNPLKYSRQRAWHDLALRRDVLRGELQATEAVMRKMEEGEWPPEKWPRP